MITLFDVTESISIDARRKITSRKTLRSDCSVRVEIFTEDENGKIVQKILDECMSINKLAEKDANTLKEKFVYFILLFNEDPQKVESCQKDWGLDDNGMKAMLDGLWEGLGFSDTAKRLLL